MSGAITAAVVVGGASIYGANKAAKAGEGAADTMAQAEQNKLNYLQETNERPQYYKEQALASLGDWYGISRGQAAEDIYKESQRLLEDTETENQQWLDRGGKKGRKRVSQMSKRLAQVRVDNDRAREDYEAAVAQDGESATGGGAQGLINDVQSSPFYGSMISQGEDAASRVASQQGLRGSGNLESRYVQNSQNVLQSLVNQRLQGLTGMANLGTNENAIGSSMANIGSIQGQGEVAGAQSQQQGYQNALTGIGTAAGQYFGNQTQQPLIGGSDPYGYGTNTGAANATNPMQDYYGNVV